MSEGSPHAALHMMRAAGQGKVGSKGSPHAALHVMRAAGQGKVGSKGSPHAALHVMRAAGQGKEGSKDSLGRLRDRSRPTLTPMYEGWPGQTNGPAIALC